MTTTKGRLPSKKKTKKKKDRLNDTIEGLVMYMELAKAARLILQNDGRMRKFLVLGLRLEIEARFCMNLLLNVCKVNPEYIAELQRTIREDEKFDKEAGVFADSVIPKDDKDVKLYGFEDLKKQIIADEKKKVRDKEVKTGSNIIMP